VHTYTFTEPSSAQVGLNMEFVMERVELQYAVVFVFILWKERFKIPEYWKNVYSSDIL